MGSGVDLTGKTHKEVEAERAKLIAKRTPKKMGEARAKMIVRVEAAQLVHMHEQDPIFIWSDLVMMHKVRGLAMELTKWQQLMTSKKGEAESITSWTSQIKGLVFELKEVGTSVPEKITIVVLTMGLGNEYDT